MGLKDRLEEIEARIINPTSADLAQINMLRQQLEKKEHYKSFLEHTVTKEIVQRLVDWIRETNLSLLDSRSIMIKERDKLITQRDCLVRLLNVFSPDKADESFLEGLVDKGVEQFKKAGIYKTNQ